VQRTTAGWGGPAVLADGLRKRFGDIEALRGVDLVVPRGTVLGVLGPNGAGKTTVVKVLTTLLAPDGGRALVEGHDVVRDAAAVREVIGLAGQSAAIQEELTGRENLELLGRLFHLSRRRARARAAELLERFGLAEAADRPARTYSGGMQRRLDLAASLVAEPAVLFLDEPTTGLDPRSRLGMWEVIRDLVAQGTTLLLTTQYLEEADELADEIVVIDHGVVIAAGTAEALKERVGGDVVEFAVADRAALGRAAAAVAEVGVAPPVTDEDSARVSLRVGSVGPRAVVDVVRTLDAAGVETEGLVLRRPSLDDVFLALTGHASGEDPTAAGEERRSSRAAGGRRPTRAQPADREHPARAGRAAAEEAPDARPARASGEGAPVATTVLVTGAGPGTALVAPGPATPPTLPAGSRTLPSARPPRTRRVRDAVLDVATLTRRDLLVWSRVPTFLVFSVVQPVMFVLLFRYVFGGAIPVRVPGGYVDFLMPGIVAQSAAFASFGTAIGLARQMQRGVIDRFRAMPIARSAVLVARLTADALRMTVTVIVIVAVGYAVGFRFRNGALPAAAMVLLSIAFGLTVCTVSAYVGLAIRDEESVGSFGLIWLFPLTFVSAAFVPVRSMPGWLQAFAANQPVTIVIDELRALALGGPLALHAWQSAAWLAGILATFLPLAVRAYRRP
jgi:ABC-2 type transport system ATP-binding protein